jgi:hypothetical protein
MPKQRERCLFSEKFIKDVLFLYFSLIFSKFKVYWRNLIIILIALRPWKLSYNLLFLNFHDVGRHPFFFGIKISHL